MYTNIKIIYTLLVTFVTFAYPSKLSELNYKNQFLAPLSNSDSEEKNKMIIKIHEALNKNGLPHSFSPHSNKFPEIIQNFKLGGILKVKDYEKITTYLVNNYRLFFTDHYHFTYINDITESLNILSNLKSNKFDEDPSEIIFKILENRDISAGEKRDKIKFLAQCFLETMTKERYFFLDDTEINSLENFVNKTEFYYGELKDHQKKLKENLQKLSDNDFYLFKKIIINENLKNKISVNARLKIIEIINLVEMKSSNPLYKHHVQNLIVQSVVNIINKNGKISHLSKLIEYIKNDYSYLVNRINLWDAIFKFTEQNEPAKVFFYFFKNYLENDVMNTYKGYLAEKNLVQYYIDIHELRKQTENINSTALGNPIDKKYLFKISNEASLQLQYPIFTINANIAFIHQLSRSKGVVFPVNDKKIRGSYTSEVKNCSCVSFLLEKKSKNYVMQVHLGQNNHKQQLDQIQKYITDNKFELKEFYFSGFGDTHKDLENLNKIFKTSWSASIRPSTLESSFFTNKTGTYCKEYQSFKIWDHNLTDFDYSNYPPLKDISSEVVQTSS